MKTRLLGWSLLALSCNSTGSDPIVDNGQTGSPGFSCASVCPPRAERAVDSFNHPSPVPTFIGASCEARTDYGVGGGHGQGRCQCLTDGEPFDVWKSDFDCGGPALRGGFCLMTDSDRAAGVCAPGADAECNDFCDSIAARLKADAERPGEARLRSIPCEMQRSVTDCPYVVEIAGECYANVRSGLLEQPAYDCALSDREIICLTEGPMLPGAGRGGRCEGVTALAGSGGMSGSGSLP